MLNKISPYIKTRTQGESNHPYSEYSEKGELDGLISVMMSYKN